MTSIQLVLPAQISDPLAASEVTKALLGAKLFGDSSSISISTLENGLQFPILKVVDSNSKEEVRLYEPNAIVKYLAKAGTLSAQDKELIDNEESKLYAALKSGSKLDESACQYWGSQLTSVNITAANVIVFGALHGLVSFAGKGALSQGLQLLLWYQKFSGNQRIQAALKTSGFGVIGTFSGNSSRTPSVAAAAAAPKSNAKAAGSVTSTEDNSNSTEIPARKMPERTGAQNTKSGIEMKKQTGAILPKEGERNILITSALPYVNNVPHLGNIIGSVMSADIFARYAKARNYNTLYICGTDEYGTATETKAIEEKMSPRDLCTKYYHIHKEVYDWFQIGFDYFGRTSTDRQTEIAQDIFLKLWNNGYLEEQSMEQLYCTEHNGYLADRFVEGTCPKCGYDDARGDQCDNCGNLMNPFELISPRCKLDNSSPEKRNTNHVFLSLDKLQDKVTEWAQKSQDAGDWTKNSKTITQNWLKEGLRPRAITRDLKWGIPVPLEAYKDKVLYVWFDACIGYVSITANYTSEWEKWWKDPEHVELFQFMGKDNVPFHTVVFPSSQIGTNEKWTMLNNLSTTEYLQYEGGKFSKSRGLGVFGNNAKDIGVSPSVWRYYLASARPETSDSQFSWAEFVTRNNSELLANLGNFVNRLIKFVNAKYNGVIPDFKTESLGSDYYQNSLETDINKLLTNYVNALEGQNLRLGLEIAMHISTRGNLFLQENKLDNSLFANFPEKSDAVIGVGLNIIYMLSALLYPYIPETTQGILDQLCASQRSIPDKFDLALLPGHNIGKAKYLFKRIDEAKIDEWKAKYGGTQQK